MCWPAVSAGIAGVGLLSSLSGGGGGTSTSTVMQAVDPMERPSEYQTLWNEFMSQYFGTTTATTGITTEASDKITKLENREESLERKIASINHRIASGEGGQEDLADYTPDLEDVQTELRFLRIESSQAGIPVPTSETTEGYKSMLETMYEEQREADEAYISDLTGLKEPYLSAVSDAMGTHADLLSEIIGKRMAGEAVGPYGADIDKLLAQDYMNQLPYGTDIDRLLADDPRVNKLLEERMGISFGGGTPMQFMTGAQQRVIGDLLEAKSANLFTLSGERRSLLSDLLEARSADIGTLTGAQETALSNIIDTSGKLAATNILPATERYGKEREIADLALSSFMPSNISDLAYMESLFSMLEPMEMARYHATPSTASTTTSTASPLQQTQSWMGNINQVLNIVSGLSSLFPAGTTTQTAAQQGIPDVITLW